MPTLQSLTVTAYELYPGKKNSPGLHVDFSSGPWIVLGVNGLGKSTLLLIVRSLLTGPHWVVDAGPAGASRSDISNLDRNLFSSRVSDGASTATASLTVNFGRAKLSITRRLSNLSIVEFTRDGQVIGDGDDLEGQYREAVTSCMGVGSFADALRILRYLAFVLEERDGLIWDSRAQAEIFRAVFMSPQRSARWRELEGLIVSSDSAARNISASLTKIQQRQDREVRKVLTAPQVRARLSALAGEQDRDESAELELVRARDRAEDRRLDARDSLRLREQEQEERKRDYERLKHHALSHALSRITPSDQYVLMTIISEHVCPACGTRVEKFAAELEARQAKSRCVVCGSQKAVTPPGVVGTGEVSEARIQRAYEKVIESWEATQKARAVLEGIEQDFQLLTDQLLALRRDIDVRARDIRTLQRKLPVGERPGAREVDEVAALRRRVIEFRNERDTAEQELEKLLLEARESVEAVKTRIEERFRVRAGQFLLEGFRLVYAAVRRTVGQTGKQLEFPSFEVELAGGAIDGTAVRRTSAQVSFSQREYLDFAFRMAVMDVVASTATMFVVDGPEGSVDAVFAVRAGQLLAAFGEGGKGGGNRLLVACNLVDTPLIPSLLARYTTLKERRARVINLLDIALPTAALRDLRPEYDAAYNRVLAGAHSRAANL